MGHTEDCDPDMGCDENCTVQPKVIRGVPLAVLDARREALNIRCARAQELDDAADEIYTKQLTFDDHEDLFHWLTDRSARLRAGSA